MVDSSAPLPLLTVRGQADLEGPPDLAAVTLTVHRTGSSQDGVRSDLAAASRQVHELLDANRAALERSSTSGLHVAPVIRGRAEKVQGYRGSFSSEFVLRDLDALSPVISALAPIADSQIDGPNWSLRPDNRLYHDVRLAAIAEARRRADDYAAAFGSTVVDLVEISDLDGGLGGGGWTPQYSARMDKGGDGLSEFEFEPRMQTVSGQVTVRFTMTRPDLSVM